MCPAPPHRAARSTRPAPRFGHARARTGRAPARTHARIPAAPRRAAAPRAAAAAAGSARSGGTGPAEGAWLHEGLFFFFPPIKQFFFFFSKLTFAPPILVALRDPSLPAAAFKFIYLPAGAVRFSLLLLLRRASGSSCGQDRAEPRLFPDLRM